MITTLLTHIASTWMTVVAIDAIVGDSVQVDDVATTTAINFLRRYGYLDENASNASSGRLTKESADQYSRAIARFQDYYRLPGNGTLNEETLNLMRTPRCGIEDISERALGPLEFKWPKKHLTWNFHLADEMTLRVTRLAFDLWARNSSLTFERDTLNPDIAISYREGLHMYTQHGQALMCPFPLDGPGGTLAHAYLPTGQPDFVSEIHVDHSEPWHISLNENPPNTSNLFQTLTHEIGHALGLSHNEHPDAVMYAFAPTLPVSVKLHLADVLSIQHLYGAKIDARDPTTTTTAAPAAKRRPTVAAPTARRTTTTGRNLGNDLCALRQIDNVLVLNDRIYVARDQLVWSIDMDKRTFKRPLRLTDYMSFLPNNFTRLSGIYQTPATHLILFVDNRVYMVDYPSFKLMAGWPRSYVEIGITENAKINAVFNNNRGQSYVIYDDHVVGEIDDCSMMIVRYHTIDKAFPGIPSDVTSAFRYTDGHLYFLRQRQYYKFNEYTKTVTTAGRFGTDTLGVACPRDGLLRRLGDLLERFVRLSGDNDDDDDKDGGNDYRSHGDNDDRV